VAGTVRTQTDLDALFVTDGSRQIGGQDSKDLIASAMGCFSSIYGDLTPEVALSNAFIPMIGYVGFAGSQNNMIGSPANGTLEVGVGGGGVYQINWSSTLQASSAVPGTDRGQITMGLWTGSAGSPTPIGGAARAYILNPSAKLRAKVDQDSASGQEVLNVDSTAGFFVGDTVDINPGGPREETGVIASIQAGVSLTLEDPLANAHTALQNDMVFDTDRIIGSYRTQFANLAGSGTFALAEGALVGLYWVLAIQAGVQESLIGIKHGSMLTGRRVG
jgi:hypothetical protein